MPLCRFRHFIIDAAFATPAIDVTPYVYATFDTLRQRLAPIRFAADDADFR